MLKQKNNSLPKIIWIYSEFILLFFGVPLCILLFGTIIHPSSLVIPVITGVFVYLRKKHHLKFKDLFTLYVNTTFLLHQLYLFFIVSVIMTTLIYYFDNDKLYNLPKNNLKIWLALCFFYPVFSAFGQEIIYRLFLFKRYRIIFKSNSAQLLASSIAFSFVHIIYYSPISIILSFLLGLYLSYLYLKTKSVLLVAILHGMYGNLIFTIGLGGYFWLDMYKWL